MKIEIERCVLEGCFRQLAKLASPKSPSPLRKYIRCEVSGGDAKLYATDGEVEAMYHWHCDEGLQANFLIDPAKLNLRLCQEIVTFEIDDCKVKVNIGGGNRYEYTTPEWAPISQMAVDGSTTLQFAGEAVEELVAALVRARVAIDNEGASGRYALAGVCFTAIGGEWHVAGTDGRRCSVLPLGISTDCDASYILPDQLVGAILGVLTGAEGADITLAPNSAQVIAGQWTVAGRLLDGRFPDISAFASLAPELVCEIDAADLAKCCEVVNPMLTADSRSAELANNISGISLTTEPSEEGQALALFSGAGAERQFATRLNVRYLADFARHAAKAEPIYWRAETPEAGQVFSSRGWQYVVMPLAKG